MSILIDRCLCYKRSFKELCSIAQTNHITELPVLQEYVEFGLKCQLCHPYVKRMLRTGETEFTQILTDADS